MKDIEKNIKAIEEEKKEYLEEHLENSGDENDGSKEVGEGKDIEVEVIEVCFDEEEINEWIEKLKKLRENKDGHIHLEIDDENELLINYEEEGE